MRFPIPRDVDHSIAIISNLLIGLSTKEMMTPATVTRLRGFIEDGLEPTFIEDADIQSLADHLVDLIDRVETEMLNVKAMMRTGETGPSSMRLLNRVHAILMRSHSELWDIIHNHPQRSLP